MPSYTTTVTGCTRYNFSTRVINDKGDELECGDNEGEEEKWLKQMLVKAEIVKIEEEKKWK